MSRYRRFEIIEPSPSLFLTQTSIFTPKTLTLNPFFPSFSVENELDFTLDLIAPTHCPSLLNFTSPFDGFDTIIDLVQIETTPFYTSTRKVQQRQRVDRLRTESYLQSLSDRVSALEFIYDRLSKAKSHVGDRKYTWTAEIESPEKHGFDRKYKWTAEIKGGTKKKSSNKVEPKVEKNYKWTAEIKGKGQNAPIKRTYTFKTSTGDAGESTKSEKKDKKKKGEKVSGTTRLVEIDEPTDHGALVLRQAFAKRVEKCRGKRKEISPLDAAMMIQMSFRAYLIRRSQALRGLRELAVAKAKLKEIRALFNNFSYRRCIARDAEERQKFTERIIVLLLTVDAIEGADLMVRASKRSMVDELEAMLDVVDPQPPGKSLSMRRRTFDMPDAVVQKELAEGVAQLVEMLDEEQSGAKHL